MRNLGQVEDMLIQIADTHTLSARWTHSYLVQTKHVAATALPLRGGRLVLTLHTSQTTEGEYRVLEFVWIRWARPI